MKTLMLLMLAVSCLAQEKTSVKVVELSKTQQRALQDAETKLDLAKLEYDQIAERVKAALTKGKSDINSFSNSACMEKVSVQFVGQWAIIRHFPNFNCMSTLDGSVFGYEPLK